MGRPTILLVDPEPARRDGIAAALERGLVEVVAVGPAEAASRALAVSPLAVALSLLPGERDLLSFVTSWREDPARQAIPLLALVPRGGEEIAERALAAGASDILFWPASELALRVRVRSLVRAAVLEGEVLGFGQALEEIVRVYEARELDRFEHSERVSRLAAALAQASDLSPGGTERIRRAALIHDIGMLGIPDSLLLKKGPLSPDEWDMLRSHPVVGAQMLRGIPAIEPFIPFVLLHHERVDGSGYPHGLSGDEIPPPVRILSLADAYGALTSLRSWRSGRPHEEAVAVLAAEAEAGHWDASLVGRLDAAAGSLSAAVSSRGSVSER